MRLLVIALFLFSSQIAFAQQPSRFADSDSTETEESIAPVEQSSNTSTTQPKEDPRSSSSSSSRSTPSSNSSIDKWRFGGMIGMSFGSYTYIELSPRVHYLVQDNFGVGGGISYYYWKDNNTYPPGYNVKREGNVYGFNVFSWYNPIKSLVLQGEFEPLNVEVYQFNENAYEREWVNGLLLGGGIRQQAGRANVFFVVLYNVLYDQNRSFYSSPWVVRIGAGF